MKNYKYSVWVSIFLAIGVIIYYWASFKPIFLSKQQGQFTFNIPKIPSLKKYLSVPKNTPEILLIGNAWGIGNSGNVNGANLIKRNYGFIYKRSNNKDAVCLISDCSYMWELYGISYVFGNYSALFYNPKLKKFKYVTTGELLDTNLKVLKVSDEKVELEFNFDNKSQLFTLKIFNINFTPKNGGVKK